MMTQNADGCVKQKRTAISKASERRVAGVDVREDEALRSSPSDDFASIAKAAGIGRRVGALG